MPSREGGWLHHISALGSKASAVRLATEDSPKIPVDGNGAVRIEHGLTKLSNTAVLTSSSFHRGQYTLHGCQFARSGLIYRFTADAYTS